MIKRGAFMVEASIMLANNLIFFILWWIFFNQFREINGWKIADMALLMGLGLASYGMLQIGFGGIKDLSRLILSGDLDPFMTQPKSLLLHIAGSKSFSKGWGHLASSFFLLTLSGMVGAATLPLALLGIVCGCAVFASIAVIAHSLPFWFGSIEGVSKKYFEALFLFALYPTNIYSGLLQVLMFTVIPAGVITYLPVELIRDFSWEKLFVLVGSTSIFVILALWTFARGLKRYESGNQFGMR